MSYPCLLFFIKEQNKNLIKYTIVNHLGKNIWVGIRRLYRDKKICLSSQKQWGAIALPTTDMKVVLLIDYGMIIYRMRKNNYNIFICQT